MILSCNENQICSRPVNPSNRVTSPLGIVARRAGASNCATMKKTNWNLNYSAGQRFGKLTTVRSFRSDQWWFECKCDCGTVKNIRKKNLTSGQIVSCGCYNLTKGITHGMTRTTEFSCWSNMKQRCSNPKAEEFHNYGGRGICVCERWQNSFENFLADMGFRPTGKSIERKNVNGNYEPSNCIWADDTTQANNTRSNHIVEFNGKSMTLAQWSRETGVNLNTIRVRILRGWKDWRAISEPAKISLWEVV